MTATDADIRPPIPASLAHRPVRGGLSQPWVNVELADGGVDFRSTHRSRFEKCWTDCVCQSCGQPTGSRAILVCGPRQILGGHFDEPPVCPPCALYASNACPLVAGRVVTYPDRPKVVEGHRGKKCGRPGCGCAGWLDIDLEHSADMGGQPVLPWYAAWVMPGAWTLTVRTAVIQCTDGGCRRGHEKVIVNGAIIDGPLLKVILISEPGNGRIWRTLTAGEAAEHATASLARAGVSP